MKKLLFIDHGFHAKTRATAFLQDLLAQHFQLEVIWDQSWAGEARWTATQLNARRADAILFFQSLPRPKALRRLDCANICWAPMRDALRYRSSRVRGLASSPIKVLNFCQEANGHFNGRGQESLAVQDWPQPASAIERPVRPSPKIFFWPRRQEITWTTLKVLLGEFRPQGIVLRYANDPGHDNPMPSEADIREYNITVLHGWLAHDEYLAQLSDCDIFVAPRPLEGIGQAMLEAMSHGLAVIAPNAPTMSEYIEDGRSGWLYDLAAPRPLTFTHWAERGIAARAAVARGHAAWLSQAGQVAAFIANPPRRQADWNWRLLRALRL